MAITIVPAPASADDQGLTAQLSPAARDAMRRLELALIASNEAVTAVARFGDAAASCRRLSIVAATTADFDRILCLQDEMAMCRCQLAAAGQLHLIEARS